MFDKAIHEMSFNEFKMYLSSMANMNGNSVTVDDFSRDGMTEYSYPKEFILNGNTYSWSIGSRHTKGKHLCTHLEMWGHGKGVGSYKFATGQLTKNKLFKFFKDIHKFYIQHAISEGKAIPKCNVTKYKLNEDHKEAI